MNKVIWIASYPRSGNAWLRALILSLMSCDMEINAAIPTFTKTATIAAPLHNVLGTKATIRKVHFTADNEYLRGSEAECIGVISIYRHPLDVLLSALNYFGVKSVSRIFKANKIKSVEAILQDGELDYYIDLFIKRDGYFSSFGPWSAHQRSWDKFASNIPHLRLRYEDMVAETRAHALSLSAFLLIPVDPRRIDAAINTVDRITRDGRFFWRGRCYNFRDIAPRDATQRFCSHYAEQLRYLGYDVEVL